MLLETTYCTFSSFIMDFIWARRSANGPPAPLVMHLPKCPAVLASCNWLHARRCASLQQQFNYLPCRSWCHPAANLPCRQGKGSSTVRSPGPGNATAASDLSVTSLSSGPPSNTPAARQYFCSNNATVPVQALGAGVAASGLRFYPGAALCKLFMPGTMTTHLSP